MISSAGVPVSLLSGETSGSFGGVFPKLKVWIVPQVVGAVPEGSHGTIELGVVSLPDQRIGTLLLLGSRCVTRTLVICSDVLSDYADLSCKFVSPSCSCHEFTDLICSSDEI